MTNENEVFKKIDVTTKIDAKENSIVATNATFYSYDANTSLIKMKLVKEGQPMSLPVGTEVLLTAVKINKDKNKLVFSPQIKDRTQGLIEWIIPHQLRGYVGSLRIGVFIKLPNNQRLHGGYFSVSMDVSDVDSDNGWTEIYWQSWDDFQSQAEAEWENWKSQQITKQSKFESDTNVYLNRIETKVNAAQADLTLLKEEMHLSEAWSNSPDGTVDFSRTKPYNYTLNSKTTVPLPFNGGWISNIANVSNELIGYVGKLTLTIALNVPQNITKELVVWIQCNGAGAVNVITQANISPNAAGSRIKLSGTFNINASSSSKIFLSANLSGDATVSIPIEEMTLVKGETPTPWTSNPADNTPENEFAKYYGLALTDSNNPADYTWIESPEYTSYKSKSDAEGLQIAWSSGQAVTRKHLIDFNKKVRGSNVGNTNYGGFINNSQNLINPITNNINENTQTAYDAIKAADGTLLIGTGMISDCSSQEVFKWNIVEQVNRDYPNLYETLGLDTLAKKVEFLKSKIKLIFDVWGYGRGPSSNKLYVKRWWDNKAWEGQTYTLTADTVKNLKITFSADAHLHAISDDGFVYLIMYADASDGTTASTVNIDYASLEYTLSFKKSDFDISKDQYAKDLGEIKDWIAAHS